jgi:hypothetical protein
MLLRGGAMFDLGGYRLDQNIHDVIGYKEDMSHVLGVGQFARMFPDEQIFKVNQVNLLGETWDCMLGVTNNKIYKIALSEMASNIFDKAYRYFLDLCGQPTTSKSRLYIWETPTANLTLSKHRPFNVVNIIATSGTPFTDNMVKNYQTQKASGCFSVLALLLVVICALTGICLIL